MANLYSKCQPTVLGKLAARESFNQFQNTQGRDQTDKKMICQCTKIKFLLFSLDTAKGLWYKTPYGFQVQKGVPNQISVLKIIFSEQKLFGNIIFNPNFVGP